MTKRSARPLALPLVPLYRLALALRESALAHGLRAGPPAALARRQHRQPLHRRRGQRRRSPSPWPRLLTERGLSRRCALARLRPREPACRPRRPRWHRRGVRRRAAADRARDRRAGLRGAERYEAGLLAEAGNSAAADQVVHLLDDGFQHRQLARDVDILLLNRADLGDHLLPAGNLREPLRAIGRAQVIAIPAGEAGLEAELEALGWKGSVWRLRRRMEVPRVDGPVVAFCGIARPEQFFQGLEFAAGFASPTASPSRTTTSYTAGDIGCFIDAARKAGANDPGHHGKGSRPHWSACGRSPGVSASGNSPAGG